MLFVNMKATNKLYHFTQARPGWQNWQAYLPHKTQGHMLGGSLEKLGNKIRIDKEGFQHAFGMIRLIMDLEALLDLSNVDAKIPKEDFANLSQLPQSLTCLNQKLHETTP